MPIAGAGKSFAEAGYVFPKALIEIAGRPMIDWVVDNIRPQEEHCFIFIIRNEDFVKFNLDSVLRMIAPNCQIIKVINPTQGAAS